MTTKTRQTLETLNEVAHAVVTILLFGLVLSPIAWCVIVAFQAMPK